MEVRQHVELPSLPLLRIERALALLKPGVLEKLKQREKHGDCTRAVFFARAMPVLGGRGKGARQLGINYDGALRLRVLPNLCRQIKERNDYADCSDQLRQSVDRFQVHNAALSNQSRFYEAEMNGGGRGGIRTHGGFPHARFRVECLKPDSATLPTGETKTPNDQRPTSNIECNCLRDLAFNVGRSKLSVCIQAIRFGVCPRAGKNVTI